MARAKVSPEIRAAALADLAAGEQPAVVAERYGLDRATVNSWKRRYIASKDASAIAPHASEASIRRQPAVESQQRQIGALILDLLSAKLQASEAIAKAALDSAWRAKQSAADLAAFGEWLDRTAFAIGDRLAAPQHPPGPDDGAE